MAMMTIDEAIKHARETAAIQRNNDKLNKTLGANSPYYNMDCLKCSEEHEQLAEWLVELKAYRLFIKMCKERKYVVHSDIFAKHCNEFIAEQLKKGGTDE